MPGAGVHLSPEDSLTTRLCYINFDGGKALEASLDIGLTKNLTGEFVNKYCHSTVSAIEVRLPEHKYFCFCQRFSNLPGQSKEADEMSFNSLCLDNGVILLWS